MKLEHSLTLHKSKPKFDQSSKYKSVSVNFLEENIVGIISNIKLWKISFVLPPRVMKIKINKWDLIKCKSFCTAKGNYKQDEKTTLRIGENICKQSNWWGIYFQNMLNKKKTKQNLISRRPKWTFLQGRHTDGQQVHEKMFSITNY